MKPIRKWKTNWLRKSAIVFLKIFSIIEGIVTLVFCLLLALVSKLFTEGVFGYVKYARRTFEYSVLGLVMLHSDLDRIWHKPDFQ